MKLLDKNGTDTIEEEPSIRERWEPLGNLILARTVDGAKSTRGFALPESVRKAVPFKRAIVVACGIGRMLECGQLDPTGVKPGDLIIYNGDVRDVEINGENLIVLDSGMVGFVVRQEPA